MSETLRENIAKYTLRRNQAVVDSLTEPEVEEVFEVLATAWLKINGKRRLGGRVERELTMLALGLVETGVLLVENPFPTAKGCTCYPANARCPSEVVCLKEES